MPHFITFNGQQLRDLCYPYNQCCLLLTSLTHTPYAQHTQLRKCWTKQLQLFLPLYGRAAMLWWSRRRSRASTTRTIRAGSCFRVKLEWCVLWHACTAWRRIQHMVHTQTVVHTNVITIVVPSISTPGLAFVEYKTALWLAIIRCRLGILHHHLLPATAEQAVSYTGNRVQKSNKNIILMM